MARQGWAGLTSSYSSGDVVVGSDNNLYISLVDPNVGNDPTTDNGTNWKQLADPVLPDQSNGHTYRLIVTNGVVGTVQVS